MRNPCLMLKSLDLVCTHHDTQLSPKPFSLCFGKASGRDVGKCGHSCPFCSLTFIFNPSSRVYGYTTVELKPNGENEVWSQLFPAGNFWHLACNCDEHLMHHGIYADLSFVSCPRMWPWIMVEEYIELVTEFCLSQGIRRQMEAFRGKCSVPWRTTSTNKYLLTWM